MTTSDRFQGLRFERWPRLRVRIHPRLISAAVALVVVSLLWVILPHNAFFWLMLPLLAALVWVASYGWRQALVTVIEALERLLQM